MKVTFSLFMLTLFLASVWITRPTPAAASVLVWSGWVYSDGVPVSTAPTILESGRLYTIVATETFWYNEPANLAADAYYYTTDPSDSWIWGNHFHTPPLPPYHSFLQIDGKDVDWGPFSNGEPGGWGHTYTIYDFIGKGAAITFRIVDWIDFDYTNNVSHLPVYIYLEPWRVGGVLTSVDKLAVLAPYLALVGLVGALSTVFAVRRKRKA